MEIIIGYAALGFAVICLPILAWREHRKIKREFAAERALVERQYLIRMAEINADHQQRMARIKAGVENAGPKGAAAALLVYIALELCAEAVRVTGNE